MKEMSEDEKMCHRHMIFKNESAGITEGEL